MLQDALATRARFVSNKTHAGYQRLYDGIVKPLQIRWDARGRLWVACGPSYPQLKPGEVADDKIVILEDTDGDGRADKSSVFAARFRDRMSR